MINRGKTVIAFKNNHLIKIETLYHFAVILVCFLLGFSSWLRFGESQIVDAVEYAVGAANIFNGEGYFISINGVRYPPRYPPFFSFLISPGFFASNHLCSAAIIPAIISSFGAYIAFRIGRKLGGIYTGIAASLGVMLFKEYWAWGGMPMTDTPLAVISLLGLYLFTKNKCSPLLVGMLVSIATMIKLPGIILIIPWMWIWIREKQLRALIVSLAPIVFAFLSIAVYQKITFGDYFRNGYQFWVSIPYDFPELTFSLRYILAYISNLNSAWFSQVLPLILLFSGSLILYKKKNQKFSNEIKTLVQYCMFVSIPWMILMLSYFFNDSRLYLPMTILLAVTSGILLSDLIKSISPKLFLAGLVFASFISLANFKQVESKHSLIPTKRDGDIIISDVNPAYLSYYFPDNNILPISRNAEYASKVIMRKKPVKNFLPASPFDHRNQGLLAQGEEVFNKVQSEIK